MSRLRSPNGLLFEFGEDRPASGLVRETVGCGHCQRVEIVYEKDKDIGGICFVCWRLICGPCADKGNCVPWEEMLARQEARSEARKSMGL